MNWLEFWYSALNAPTGICLRVLEGNFEQARQQLYKARREAADETLDSLSIVQSPTDAGELWIVKRNDPA